MQNVNPIDQYDLGDAYTPPPPPQPSKAAKFGRVLGQVAAAAGSVMIPGLGGGFGGIFGGLGVGIGGLGADGNQYLRLQQQIEEETRAFETISNVLKARHDAAMDSLRNIAH